MSANPKYATLVQLRRLLRRLDRAHTSEESTCPACSLQRLALQLNEEVEAEATQLNAADLPPGSASVGMAIESVLTVIYTLDVRAADEQGRVVQALLDYIGEVVMDQLAHDEHAAGGEKTPDEEPGTPEGGFPPQRRGSLH
jgi:hypothetical protein